MKSKIGAEYSLSCDESVPMLERIIQSGRVPILWGPPGIGKSDSARQVAENLGMDEYIDLRASMLDPVEVHGMPYRDGNTMRWAPPAIFPQKGDTGKYLLNIDELSYATMATQGALQQLILERHVGETELADGVVIMACSNEEGQGTSANRMSSAVANRMRHLYVRADLESWIRWAVDKDIAWEVIFFLQMRPELLHQFDPRSKEHAFPSPRTWEFVSDDVAAAEKHPISAEIERAGYVGTVGEAAGNEFCAFLRIKRQLPHPQTIIDDPKGAVIPEDPSAQVAMAGALYKLADDTNFDAIVTYSERPDMRRELGEFTVSQCVKRDPKLQYNASYVKHLAKRNS